MRPEISRTETKLYECFACGGRETAPDTRGCDRCGGELRNLGRERDL
ncbi:MAG: rubrerythrin-like domain-containing protein [Haloarculaceae archaeon]